MSNTTPSIAREGDGPTQMDYENAGERWQGRVALARTLKVLIVITPIAASLATSYAASRFAPHTSLGINRWVWWAGVIALSTLVLAGTEKLTRRFLPLAALLKLSLVFPDEAPNRFKAALRTGTAGQMKKRIAALDEHDRGRTDGEYLLDLLAALADHDRLTRGHSERVRAYADMIAEELELSPDDADRLHWAAMLHDLGKLHVPSDILNKAGRPTDEEFATIKSHPAAGLAYVEPLADWLGDWLRAVDQHHERWDGGGYPLGLAGEQIHLSGRIVAVADAFDVITSSRSYKRGLSPDLAREEIARCAGSQFDPAVVRAFLNVGLGRLRLAAGPLAWLSSFPTVADRAIAPALGTVASGAAAVAAAGIAGVAGWWPADDVAIPAPVGVESRRAPVELTANDELVQIDESTTLEFTIGGSGDGPVTVRIIEPPRSGSVTIVGEAGTAGDTWRQQLSYRPAEGFSGQDRLTFEVCEADDCERGIVEFEVRPLPPQAPVAGDDLVPGLEDTPASIRFADLLSNDTDANRDPLAVVGVEAEPDLAIVVGPDRIDYTPPPERSGPMSLTYEVCDPGGRCATAQITLELEAVPDPPEVVDDRFDAVENTPGSIPTEAVLRNDTDADGDDLVVARVGPATNVTAQLDGAVIRYTPDPDFAGPATARYSACDPTGRCTTGTVIIDVAPAPNQRPVASSDRGAGYEVPEDGVLVTPDVTANDTDPDNPVLATSAALALAPSHGTAIANGDGTFTYEPLADFFGTDLFTYTITDGEGAESLPASITVTVTPINDAPIAADDAGSGFTTEEDTAFATASVTTNDRDVDDPIDPTTIAVVTSPIRGTATPNGDGTFLYSPDPDESGIDTFTYTLTDGSGATSEPARVTIAIGPANDAPIAVDDGGIGFSTSEDMAFTTPVVTANDRDRDHPIDDASVEVVTGPTHGIATAVGDGSFTYVPDPDFVGEDTWTYRITDAAGLSSPPATVVVTVTPVNDPPSFTAGAGPVVSEDSGAQTIPAWASSISRGPVDEATQTIAFSVTNDNSALFAVPPSIDPVGTLSFTPAADAAGSATVEVTLGDDGGTAAGGADTSSVQSFTITVVPVNDTPGFVRGADQTLSEDAGPQSLPGWAAGISPGPGSEAGQSVAFVVTSDTPSLFTAPPTIDPAGTLTYTPVADAHGVATVTVTLRDDGGTANGGVDTSPAETFTITIDPVNDAPAFTVGPDQTVVEDAGSQAVPGWATAISAGPPDESAQTLTFAVTANSNPSLFASPPSISSTGELTFTAADDAAGSATITVELTDDGGVVGGGADTSAAQTFAIDIDPVNDAPSFTTGADVTVVAGSGPYAEAAWATSITPGPPEEWSQTVSFTVTNDANSLFTGQPTVDASGGLAFTPASGISGVATVSVTAVDDGGTANGGVDTSPTQTFVIIVQEPDRDGVPTAIDNCPTTFNPVQTDTDGDGSGDECDPSPTAASGATFTDSGQTLGSAKSSALAVGDLDADGDLDVVFANDTDGNTVYRGLGTGILTDSGQALGTPKSGGVALGDLDGDGDLDVVFANRASTANTVWRNDGSGVFTDTGQALGSASSEDVVVGDVDGDGDLDLVFANDNEPNAIWFNDGSGTFTTSLQTAETDPSLGVDIADLDGDGDLDLAFANNNVADRVYLNDGGGVFSDSGQTLSATKSYAVAIADVDSDGDLDLVVAADNDPSTIWLNDGGAVFTDSGQTIGPLHNRDLDLGDLDGDGDLDIVFADHSTDSTVWLNDGSGAFTDSGQSITGNNTEGVALADLDGDGDLGIVMANDGQANTVWSNS